MAFTKAVLAGVAGALVWEIGARTLIWLGVPLLDLVRLLGTLLVRDAPAWQWWPAGMLAHAMVGAIWAVFYAYFFWSDYPWRPLVQGAVFSLLPAGLAGLIMLPQMGWMHPAVLNGSMPHPGVFAGGIGWGGPTGVFIGHLLFGVTLGCLYTRPVGYHTGRGPDLKLRPGRSNSPPSPDASDGHFDGDGGFMFATGIECSCPTIDHGRWRRDQLAETGHYRHWRQDLELVRELGLRHLRYGPPLHRTWIGPDRYDWSFTDAVTGAMQELDIVPIMDLCHFGLPTWLDNFQNPEFADRFPDYATAFARRYPWVWLYTPVNEMYVTAKMSALDGVWNEQLRSERAFVTAARHLVRASLTAMEAILRQQPRAIFVNSESSEFFQPCCPDEHVVRTAEFENARRFIALDLLYGVPPGERVRGYLTEHGMSDNEYGCFMEHGRRAAERAVLGIDYYEWNEKLINSQGRPEALGELFGWFVITRQYRDRYRRPLMHTETNCLDARAAPNWLWRQWHNVQLMRRSGVPVVGFTWYSLIDQIDWDIGLSRAVGNVNPVGLFDLNRDPRPVAQSYRQLVKMFGHEPLVSRDDHRRQLDELVTGNGGVESTRSSEHMDTSRARRSAPA